jgi:hypothetical protein
MSALLPALGWTLGGIVIGHCASQWICYRAPWVALAHRYAFYRSEQWVKSAWHDVFAKPHMANTPVTPVAVSSSNTTAATITTAVIRTLPPPTETLY